MLLNDVAAMIGKPERMVLPSRVSVALFPCVMLTVHPVVVGTPFITRTGNSLNVNVTNQAAAAGLTDTQLRATAVPVSISNLPGTQPVSGTVAVSNLPATQPISGNVGVTGSVSVTNLPATQPVSGSIAVNNFPVTQAVSGGVSVNNFPSSQAISGTVGINNFPATQAVSVSNLPATQAISAVSLPLPSGASTASAQATINTAIGAPADVAVTDPTFNATAIALLKGLLQKSIPAGTTGAAQDVTLAANVAQTIAANVNRKGLIVSSSNGTILIGIGFTATATRWSYRIVTNGTMDIPQHWAPLSVSLFSTSAGAATVTIIT